MAMAQQNHLVAAHRAAPYWAVFWPAFRVSEKTRYETSGDPLVMGNEWQVDVNEGICRSETLPRRSDIIIAIHDPLVPAQDSFVNIQVFFILNFTAVFLARPISAFSKPDDFQREQRQTRYLRQPPVQRGFATTRMAEHRYLFHA